MRRCRPDEAQLECLSLQQLAFAYAGNPALRAERARQRATDEAVPQALSGWRPVITAEANAGPNTVETIETSVAR